jgi:hypothetical protein
MTAGSGSNALLVGKLLGFSGIALTLIAGVTWMEWLPFSRPASRALTLIFATTAGIDLLIAFFFVSRYKR